MVLLLAHATFKAALFMSVGVVDHATHTRDLRRLDHLGRQLPVAVAVAVVASASMAGIPPLLGFIAKEGALASLGEPGSPGGLTVVVLVVVGSVLTVAYSARLAWGLVSPATPPDDEVAAAVAHRPSPWFVAPGAVLAVICVVAGVVPTLLTPLVDAADAWLGGVAAVDLALWHGVTGSLGWSAVVLGGGAVLFVARHQVERLQSRLPHLPGSQAGYDLAVRGLLRGADRVTGVVQSGSLPVYLGIISLVAVATGAPLLRSGHPVHLRWLDTPLQLVPTIVMAAAAVAAAVARRRLAAVVLLGAVGYGMAAFFLIQGAPDLAVTQLLVETLSVVAYVLVLRHLPDRYPPAPRASGARMVHALRIAISLAVGVFVFGFAVVATGQAHAPAVTQQYVDRALPEAGGHNVVNVIVVDFRGFDTLGEITVLVTAALGVAALVTVGRRERDGGPDEGERPGGPDPVELAADGATP